MTASNNTKQEHQERIVRQIPEGAAYFYQDNNLKIKDGNVLTLLGVYAATDNLKLGVSFEDRSVQGEFYLIITPEELQKILDREISGFYPRVQILRDTPRDLSPLLIETEVEATVQGDVTVGIIGRHKKQQLQLELKQKSLNKLQQIRRERYD